MHLVEGHVVLAQPVDHHRQGDGVDPADLAGEGAHVAGGGDGDLEAFGLVGAHLFDQRQVGFAFGVGPLRIVEGDDAVEIKDQPFHGAAPGESPA